MWTRGVRQPHAWTTTSKLTETFLEDPATRSELLRLV
ncbi:MAG: hypothetical protein EXS15_08660 [Phycisphaerales bacterium]|nr:hypothetical protein [Phycisphaerales bacterium]